jgi:6-phospho-beta-glucosidase
MKLVILGGGGFRTPYVWQALIRDQGSPRVTEVALYDVDEARLATITAILHQLADGFPDVPALPSGSAVSNSAAATSTSRSTSTCWVRRPRGRAVSPTPFAPCR